jgi:ankyrin repeat protein
LQAGIHPDARNKAGETPLMAASANGHTEAVAALLAGGADPNIQNEGAFHWMYNTALAQAASNGHRDVVETLVRAGADPDARNTIRYGPLVNRHTIQTTALMEATIEGNVEAVAALVEAGADLNLPVLFNGRACDGATARYFVSKVVVCEIPIPRNAPDFGFKLVGAPPAIRKFWRDSRRFTAKVKALCDLCDLRSIPDFQLPIEADEKEAYNRIAVIFASQDSFANFTRARQNGDIRAAMIALLETLRSNPKHALACRYLNMAFCPKCANYVNWRGLSEVAMDRFLIGRCPKCEKPISFHDVDIQEN